MILNIHTVFSIIQCVRFLFEDFKRKRKSCIIHWTTLCALDDGFQKAGYTCEYSRTNNACNSPKLSMLISRWPWLWCWCRAYTMFAFYDKDAAIGNFILLRNLCLLLFLFRLFLISLHEFVMQFGPGSGKCTFDVFKCHEKTMKPIQVKVIPYYKL